MAIDVKVFGFLTIPEDATIGVSAHEIGHLREHQNPPIHIYANGEKYLDGLTSTIPTIPHMGSASGA